MRYFYEWKNFQALGGPLPYPLCCPSLCTFRRCQKRPQEKSWPPLEFFSADALGTQV